MEIQCTKVYFNLICGFQFYLISRVNITAISCPFDVHGALGAGQAAAKARIIIAARGRPGHRAAIPGLSYLEEVKPSLCLKC